MAGFHGKDEIEKGAKTILSKTVCAAALSPIFLKAMTISLKQITALKKEMTWFERKLRRKGKYYIPITVL